MHFECTCYLINTTVVTNFLLFVTNHKCERQINLCINVAAIFFFTKFKILNILAEDLKFSV